MYTTLRSDNAHVHEVSLNYLEWISSHVRDKRKFMDVHHTIIRPPLDGRIKQNTRRHRVDQNRNKTRLITEEDVHPERMSLLRIRKNKREFI